MLEHRRSFSQINLVAFFDNFWFVRDLIFENPSKGGSIAAITRDPTSGALFNLGDGSSGTENKYFGSTTVPEFSLTTMLVAVLISGFVLMFVIRRKK